MEYFKKICRLVDVTTEKMAKASAWGTIVLILVIAFEVGSRYILNKPTSWAYEMSYFLSSFVIVMTLAYTLQTKNHVNIDIFYNKFSRRTQLILSLLFTLLFFFPLWYLTLQIMLPNVLHSYNTGERSSYGSWLPLIWPFKAWLFIGLLLLLIQGIFEFLKDVIRLVKGDDFI
ncbi:TRAP transporter small permease subunit [Sutcliffiella cohnii]